MEQTIHALSRMTLFRRLLKQRPLAELIQTVDNKAASPQDRAEAAARFFHALTMDELLWRSPEMHLTDDPWDAWLIHHVLSDENPWTLALEHGQTPTAFHTALAKHDLKLLSDARSLLRRLAEAYLPGFSAADLSVELSTQPDTYPAQDQRSRLVETMIRTEDWSRLADDLTAFYEEVGAGPVNVAFAFRYENGLIPVMAPDPVRLEELTGYEKERAKVLHNTERLIQRLPAHNLLLYGDRGTGKSATVKALVHRYGPQGLRLVEISKGDLHALPALVRSLGKRAARFIVFIDDLSFEAEETEYKELKAALEGSLEPMPANVRIYATSNRRHLITEKFADRRMGAFGTANDEVRSQDGIQEKLSLADRFGQTIIFPTPSQQAYLEIVHALAKRHGVTMDEDELTNMALRWAAWHNGRSARTARQFIDTLIRA